MQATSDADGANFMIKFGGRSLIESVKLHLFAILLSAERTL